MILITIVNGIYKPTYNWGAPYIYIYIYIYVYVYVYVYVMYIYILYIYLDSPCAASFSIFVDSNAAFGCPDIYVYICIFVFFGEGDFNDNIFPTCQVRLARCSFYANPSQPGAADAPEEDEDFLAPRQRRIDGGSIDHQIFLKWRAQGTTIWGPPVMLVGL